MYGYGVTNSLVSKIEVGYVEVELMLICWLCWCCFFVGFSQMFLGAGASSDDHGVGFLGVSWQIFGFGIAVGADMIESHLVFFGVDDLGYGQEHRFLFLMCRHAFKYAIVDTVAVLFEEFDHAAAAFIVGNVVGYDYHVLAGAGTVIFYHLEI